MLYVYIKYVAWVNMEIITGMGVKAGIIGALDISRGDMFIIG